MVKRVVMKRKAVSLAKASAKVKKKIFDGKKTINDEGLTALNRKYTDQKAWEERRKKERPPPGGWPKPPAHWPPGVRVHIGRPVYWLPEGWGEGVKTTCASKLRCYISPEGKAFYHRHIVEAVHGEKLGRPSDSPEKALKWAKTWSKDRITAGELFGRGVPDFGADVQLFKNLTKRERTFLLASGSEFHFAVISARRADNEKGLRAIVSVEAQLRAGGAKPTWYVDGASLQSYRNLGLNAKVGGKLVPARNMALDDARKAKKPCVQVSDDISRWDYFVGDLGRAVDLDAANEAARSADRLRISPVAAARFLLAKLRAARAGGDGPKLAGVYPLGNTGMAFSKDAITMDNFILGDYFVAEPTSTCRFDPCLTLKEDYDYTCAHLDQHGSVLRCNRLFVAAAHQTNEGGAVSDRDSKGNKERENIAILQQKWPGVFRINGVRGDTEVVMNWKWRRTSQQDPKVSKGSKPEKAAGGVKRTIGKARTLCAVPSSSSVIQRTSKKALRTYIAERCRRVSGKTVGQVLNKLQVKGSGGTSRAYLLSDLRYDLHSGYLTLKKAHNK
mmetsp:Transcript_113611/g.331966  ORF Transcript_113611/g.331966 Transcript_113611/m.331966 type:complete len:559 (+) Transcript_113611:45-1721(+)